MRHTRSQTGSRRSHHALKSKFVVLCENCGNPKAKHVVCANCGKYKGRLVIDMQKKLDKAQAKREDKKKVK
jgi:large subunit ribosomal protein L32